VKQIILGTAGHIDHGKTSLIKALTGIDTDRLKEEKLRGITIELGFASLDLPSGQHLGIVDVPGHEKFVKNMVAGATGIDIVALVIAADEGVMPQTREHMEICTLLDVRHGLVVVSKIDLVDEEWLELAMEDIRDFVRGTFLDGAAIIAVSSATGQGLDHFVRELDNLSRQIPDRKPGSLFRLPIDRVFTMRGFGTVITGTLISGQIQVGDTIAIYPSGITSKVRGIQVHNRSVSVARAGMRTAINFQGLDRSALNRGEVLSTPGALQSSYIVDVFVHYLASNKKPLKNRTRVRFHTGTSEILGIVILVDRDELVPGQNTVAQIRLDSPVALVKDDRFVIRSYSPVRTVGGGRVLNPIPEKHKRFKADVIDRLTQLVDREPVAVIVQQIQASGYRGVSFSDLKLMANLPDRQLEAALQGLLSKKVVVLTDKENRVFLHQESVTTLQRDICNHLAAYHRKNPLKAGMPKEELKSKFPPALSAKSFTLVLNQMIKDNDIVQEGETVRLNSHQVALQVDQSEIRRKILAVYRQEGLTPPYFKDLCQSLHTDPSGAKDVLMVLVNQGQLIKVKEELYFPSQAVEQLKARMVEFLKANPEMSTPQFKEIAGVSRKYLIPLLEYFDSQNVTIRVGDVRKLRRG